MLHASTALLLLNVQTAWDHPHWGSRSHPGAEEVIGKLLAAFRTGGRPVVHVRHDAQDPHSPLHPGEPGHAFKTVAAPRDGEWVCAKRSSSAFVGTDLEAYLRGHGVDRIVVAGFTAPHDVSSTVRHGADLGFKLLMVRDGIVAYELEREEGGLVPAEEVHRGAMLELVGIYGVALDSSGLLNYL